MATVMATVMAMVTAIAMAGVAAAVGVVAGAKKMANANSWGSGKELTINYQNAENGSKDESNARKGATTCWPLAEGVTKRRTARQQQRWKMPQQCDNQPAC